MPATPSDKLKARFAKDLARLRAKYPMVYIETWNPDDYHDSCKDVTDDSSADWAEDRHLDTTAILEHNFDASQGTNWDRIRDARGGV